MNFTCHVNLGGGVDKEPRVHVRRSVNDFTFHVWNGDRVYGFAFLIVFPACRYSDLDSTNVEPRALVRARARAHLLYRHSLVFREIEPF